MEWFIYAIISAIFGGLYHFSAKMAAEYDHDSSLSTFHSMLFAGVVSAVMFLFNPHIGDFIFISIIAILDSIFYFIATYTRIDSLKYIQATLYYPIYKLFVAVSILLIGIFLFKDSLSIKQAIGLFLGIATILLLIQKKEGNINKDVKKGLILLVFGVIGAAGASVFAKMLAVRGENIFAFIFISNIFMVLQSAVRYRKTKKKNHSKKFVKRVAYFAGLMSFLGYYMYIKALSTGPFAIVYLINSFSIIIITLLSVLIYKDNFDKRKALALALSVASLVFLR